MNFQLVDVFEQPYKNLEWLDLSLDQKMNLFRNNHDPKSLTQKESRVVSIINNHFDAAVHMIQKKADNALESHVESALSKSEAFQAMIEAMPTQVPPSIEKYKNEYPSYSLQDTLIDIERHGNNLHEGQILFHGGYFPYHQCTDEGFITERPLSTSFCPQIALRNAEWRGKAFDQGEIHLLVLRINSPSVKAFVFGLNGELGNEKEVLISSNVILRPNKVSMVKENYILCKVDESLRDEEKFGKAYVIEIDVEKL